MSLIFFIFWNVFSLSPGSCRTWPTTSWCRWRWRISSSAWSWCPLARLFSSKVVFLHFFCALASALGIATGLIPYDRQEIVNPPLPFKFSPKVQWQHSSGPSVLKIINLLLQGRGLLVKVGACSTRWFYSSNLVLKIREYDLRGTGH